MPMKRNMDTEGDAGTVAGALKRMQEDKGLRTRARAAAHKASKKKNSARDIEWRVSNPKY
jgi:hypothetical protein